MRISSALLCLALAAPAGDDDVASLVRQAEEAAAEKRYDEASELFARAYQLEPSPLFLYARAQVERLAGRCEIAVVLFRDFLEAEDDPAARRPAEGHLEQCEKILAEREPPPAEDPPEPDPVPPPPSPRPWYTDALGGALSASGVVVAAVGFGLYGRARVLENNADESDNVQDYGDTIERASTLSQAGLALVGIGGAVLLGGVIRYAVVGTKNRKIKANAAVRPGGAGFVITF